MKEFNLTITISELFTNSKRSLLMPHIQILVCLQHKLIFSYNL